MKLYSIVCVMFVAVACSSADAKPDEPRASTSSHLELGEDDAQPVEDQAAYGPDDDECDTDCLKECNASNKGYWCQISCGCG